jgi:hypothetical protein
LLCYLVAQHRTVADDIRPYQFSFNIVDFQHRFEKKGMSKTRRETEFLSLQNKFFWKSFIINLPKF